ncbi:hypothetical protein L210DRAFT_3631257, partial [Boletus edulis BED1]
MGPPRTHSALARAEWATSPINTQRETPPKDPKTIAHGTQDASPSTPSPLQNMTVLQSDLPNQGKWLEAILLVAVNDRRDPEYRSRRLIETIFDRRQFWNNHKVLKLGIREPYLAATCIVESTWDIQTSGLTLVPLLLFFSTQSSISGMYIHSFIGSVLNKVLARSQSLSKISSFTLKSGVNSWLQEDSTSNLLWVRPCEQRIAQKRQKIAPIGEDLWILTGMIAPCSAYRFTRSCMLESP